MSETVDVWKIEISLLPFGIVQESAKGAADFIRSAIEDLEDGREVEVTIRKGQMERSQLDALEEFEGF